ncbi:MAG: hypothetical protein PF436_04340 [Prolixibacteraceae bacterium]|jgi:uncharacterized membrane protein|nr:hypothetical protein [Prolixibacteraceae bacterium]
MESIRYFHQPTISESLGNGWHTMKKYFFYLLLAVIIAGIFRSGSNTFQYNFSSNDILGTGFDHNWDHFSPFILTFVSISALFVLAFAILIRPVFLYGADLMFLQGVRDTKPDFRSLIIGFQKNYINIVVASLLVTIIVIVGFILLIIPGIIAACRLFMVPYLVMDKQMGGIEAIETSWQMTRGYGFTIFGLGVTSFFIFIGGLLLLIVGVFPALILINASFATLYQAIVTQNENESNLIENNAPVI